MIELEIRPPLHAAPKAVHLEQRIMAMFKEGDKFTIAGWPGEYRAHYDENDVFSLVPILQADGGGE